MKPGTEIGIGQSLADNILNEDVSPDRCAAMNVNDPPSECLPEYLEDLYSRSSVSLPENDKQKLKTLLIKYKAVFAKSNDDLGCTNIIEHKIDTRGATPIRQPPRRLPLAKRQTERDEIKKMLDRGVIEPSVSEWSSPVVLLTKKDGSTRFAIDYRKINEVIKKDSFPLPRIDDCLDALGGSVYFSCMDLNQGFLQMSVAQEDREKTAFATSLGLFQFLRLPFGLVTAPSEFSRLMGEVLRGLQWLECLVYMDDIIVPSSTVDENLTRLEHVFQRLITAKLKLKPKKCVFFQKSVKVLGHVVSADGVHTDEEKISAVKQWPIPTSAKQLKSFLGLATYYKRFVPDFSKIAKPLYSLCGKNNKYKWNSDANLAFETLKTALTSAPILAYPQDGLPFCLDTDASDFALGAVLSQKHDDGQERVVAYMSKTLSPCEAKYCTISRSNCFKTLPLLFVRPNVLLRTDNAAVSWIHGLKNPSGQMARWLQYIETYDLTVTHRAGRLHTNADALSRAPCKTCTRQNRQEDEISQTHAVTPDQQTSQVQMEESLNSNTEVIRATTRGQQQTIADKATPSLGLLEGWSPADIHHDQIQDSTIGPILIILEASQTVEWNDISGTSALTKTLWRQRDRLEIHNGMLYRKWVSENEKDNTFQLIVPSKRIPDVLYNFHNIPSAGHLGLSKMLDRVRQSFYWPAMTKDLEKYCNECDLCAARKPIKMTRAPLGENPVGEPREKVALDILGPLPLTEKGNKYVLVIADVFTKYTEAIALPDQEAKTVASAFIDNYIVRMGTPLSLLSDNGSNFESQLFKEVCDLLGIKKVTTSVARPQANGTVERFNRTLTSMLTMYCSKNQKQWDTYLPQVMMAYRSSKHATTGMSPNYLTYGREINLPMTAVIGLPPGESVPVTDYAQNLQEKLVKAHAICRQNLFKQSTYNKRHYDLKSKERQLKPGQAVWLYEPVNKTGVCAKLSPKWQGPYLIMRKIDDIMYLLKRSPRKPAKSQHIDRLRPYNGSSLPKWFKKVVVQ